MTLEPHNRAVWLDPAPDAILVDQLLGSTVIDQFSLLGMVRRPVDAVRAAGLMVIVAGIAIMEFGNLRTAASR